MKNIKKRPLFIFEMANNHQGSLEHGLKILKEFHQISKDFDFNFGFKLQYRDLESFIHPDYKDRYDIKYVKRFSEAKLTEKEFETLKNEIERLGFISICTPFDENSVDLIEKHDYDVIKIGSPSFGDWPLLERVVKTKKPIIVSVGGAELEDIDKVVSFLQHREKEFSLMHCVSQYPTPNDKLQLNQIDLLKRRYPNVEIGYSTHEEPDNINVVKMAVAKGATIFEKHVGVEADKISLNDYSIKPEQAREWLSSAKEAFDSCGVIEERAEFSEKELADLKKFKRGVFANRDIKEGEYVDLSNTFLSWPNQENQLLASDMSKYMDYKTQKDISEKEPVFKNDVSSKNNREKVYEIMVRVRDLLKDANIPLPDKLEVEISHHYGIDKFDQYGATIINCVNRAYCKKIIVLLPGQSHPTHFHKKKEETFQVLYGNMNITIGGKGKEYKPGDIVLVKAGAKHNFKTDRGAIFEEVSTTHFKNDSFYEDKKIVDNSNRKTRLTYWLNLD